MWLFNWSIGADKQINRPSNVNRRVVSSMLYILWERDWLSCYNHAVCDRWSFVRRVTQIIMWNTPDDIFVVFHLSNSSSKNLIATLRSSSFSDEIRNARVYHEQRRSEWRIVTVGMGNHASFSRNKPIQLDNTRLVEIELFSFFSVRLHQAAWNLYTTIHYHFDLFFNCSLRKNRTVKIYRPFPVIPQLYSFCADNGSHRLMEKTLLFHIIPYFLVFHIAIATAKMFLRTANMTNRQINR